MQIISDVCSAISLLSGQGIEIRNLSVDNLYMTNTVNVFGFITDDRELSSQAGDCFIFLGIKVM